MKLSFSTLGCPGWSFQKVLEEAFRMGFDGVEIRGIDGVMRAEEIPAFLPENVRQTKEALQAYGVRMVGLGTSAAFHEDAAYEYALDEGKRAAEVCRRMGIPFIRVFGDRVARPDEREETVRRVIRGIGELCAYAGPSGVQVLLEIHGDFNRLETVTPVLTALADVPNFGILWDIEHSDKVYGEDWRQFYEVIKPWIRHVHIKDYHREGWKPCLPGRGDIPIKAIVDVLRRDGYKGYYSLEWEKKWAPELEEPETAFPVYRDLMETLR